ncbi:MAG: glycosyltransferase family 2 protein [Planctomycetes bacterium]|nr:glycosyltransferase family 2 protein [Planctomycetota bacterium]
MSTADGSIDRPAAADDHPELSVVVLSWNTRELTLACLRALFAEAPRHTREVIVVDNGSEDGSADAIAAAFPQVRLECNADNRGYSGGNNQGAALARGEFLCLLNSDTEVRAGALDALVDWLVEHPEYAMAAPRLVHPDGRVQTACMRFPGLLTAACFDTWLGRFWPGSWIDRRYHMRDFDHLSSRDVDQPPGACCVMLTAEYRDGGGLDERLWLFFNDVDLCRRLWRRGRRIRYVAEAEVMHHVGASTRGFRKFVVMWHRNRLAYYRKHYGPLVLPYLRLVVRMRAYEEWRRAARRNTDPGAIAAERAHLREAVQEILQPLEV